MNTMDIIKAREKYLDPLYRRMDIDAKKLDWTNRFQLMALDKPDIPLDNVVNVTMNYDATYINDLATLITQANIQTVIQGFKNNRKLSDKEAGTIEDFLDNHYEMIDDSLNNQGYASLLIWLANHILSRGWIGGRYCAWVDKGIYRTDFAPWDMRYSAWENDYSGTKWGSIRTWRLPSELKAEAEERQKAGVEVNIPFSVSTDNKEIEVVTFYDDEKEEVWTEGSIVSTWKYNYGSCPAIIQAAPAGFMLRGQGYIQHEGESALFLNRLLSEELNRSVSIEQTLAHKAASPPYTQQKSDPNAPADPYPDKPGAQTAYNTGESPILLPVGDFNQAAQLGRRDILEALQQGGRNVDIGNINQAFSAVAIASIQEIRKKVLDTRFQAIAAFKQKLSRKIIEQAKVVYNFSDMLGGDGQQKRYSLSDLEANYTIRYKFLSKSKEMEIANLALANAAKAIGWPDEVIVRDIMMAENPDEILAKMNAQKVELAEPWVMFARLGHSAIDEAEAMAEDAKDSKLLEARGLFERAVSLIAPADIETQQEPKPIEQPKGNSNMLISLMGANRGIGGGQGNGSKEV